MRVCALSSVLLILVQLVIFQPDVSSRLNGNDIENASLGSLSWGLANNQSLILQSLLSKDISLGFFSVRKEIKGGKKPPKCTTTLNERDAIDIAQ